MPGAGIKGNPNCCLRTGIQGYSQHAVLVIRTVADFGDIHLVGGGYLSGHAKRIKPMKPARLTIGKKPFPFD